MEPVQNQWEDMAGSQRVLFVNDEKTDERDFQEWAACIPMW